MRRRAVVSVVLWAYGVATTVLLIGVWGRSVSSDEATLEASARAAVEADAVAASIEDWVADGLASATGVAAPEVATALEDIGETPQAGAAIDAIVDQTVDAALAAPGEVRSVDVRTSVRPLTPVIVERLAAAGTPVTPQEVELALSQVPELILAPNGRAEVSGVVAEARAVLTRVVVVAAAALVMAGAAAVALAQERLAMVRSLASRLAVSSLTFALITRLGAWAVAPDGGRSPIAAGGAVLLRSNGLVLILVAAGALAAAGGSTAWLARRRWWRRRVRRPAI